MAPNYKGAREVLTTGSLCTETPSQLESESSTGSFLVLTSITNLFQTIVGSGLLSLPYALLDGGAGLGAVNVAIMGLLSFAGFLAIGQVCNETGARTYRDAWLQTVGRGEKYVDIAIFLETSIVMVSFTILIIDYLGVILSAVLGVTAERGLLAVAITIPVLLPLSLQPRLHNLRWCSFFGNCAVLYTIFYVIVESRASEGGHLMDATFLSDDRNGIFRATSVMASAYISHYNAPDIFGELSPHPRHWDGFVVSVVVSFASVVALYGSFALAGYDRFGPMVQGNILLNYGTSGAIMVSWCSMLVTLIASFALHVKPARDGLAQSLGLQLYKGPQAEQMICFPFVAVSLSVVAAVVVTGTVCTNVSWILAFRGALLAFPISLAMPGLMLLNCPGSSVWFRRTCGLLLLIAGVGNSWLGLYCAFIDIL